MIPDIKILSEELTELEEPSNTYYIDSSNERSQRISGYVNDLEAIAQAIYLILNTERYEHIIYSWDYGVELIDLIGQPIPYVMSEIPRRVEEALTQDDRIETVKDFEFERDKDQLHVTFTVVTTVGDISTNLEVSI
jgi:phage baseplate assembly protein W